MYKRLLAATIVFCLIPALGAMPSDRTVTNRTKSLFQPFVGAYTRLQQYVQSDAAREKAHKAWGVAQKVAVVTVIANILLPNDVKHALCRMPIANRFMFNYSTSGWCRKS